MQLIMTRLAQPNYFKPISSCIPMRMMGMYSQYAAAFLAICRSHKLSIFYCTFYRNICSTLSRILFSNFSQFICDLFFVPHSPRASPGVKLFTVFQSPLFNFFGMRMSPFYRRLVTPLWVAFSVCFLYGACSFTVGFLPPHSADNAFSSITFGISPWHTPLYEIKAITP